MTSLSDKINLLYNEEGDEEANCFSEKDVKEAVKELKEKCNCVRCKVSVNKFIDEIFGSKLI